MNSNLLYAKTPPVRLFFLASLPGAVGIWYTVEEIP